MDKLVVLLEKVGPERFLPTLKLEIKSIKADFEPITKNSTMLQRFAGTGDVSYLKKGDLEVRKMNSSVDNQS